MIGKITFYFFLLCTVPGSKGTMLNIKRVKVVELLQAIRKLFHLKVKIRMNKEQHRCLSMRAYSTTHENQMDKQQTRHSSS